MARPQVKPQLLASLRRQRESAPVGPWEAQVAQLWILPVAIQLENKRKAKARNEQIFT